MLADICDVSLFFFLFFLFLLTELLIFCIQLYNFLIHLFDCALLLPNLLIPLLNLTFQMSKSDLLHLKLSPQMCNFRLLVSLRLSQLIYLMGVVYLSGHFLVPGFA